MSDALILFSVVALVVFVIAPFLVTMCCLATFKIGKTIIGSHPTGQVVQDQHEGDQGHVNLAMELDVNDLQLAQQQTTRTSIGLLGSLRSSLGRNVLEVALEEVLVHHDELSVAYEDNLIAEQQMKKTNALGSSLGSKNLTNALKYAFKVNNEIDNQQMLGSTWPQPKRIKM